MKLCSYRVILEVQTSKLLITQIQNVQCLVSPELPWCLTLLHSCTCSHLHNTHSQVLSTCSPHFLLHLDGADLKSRKRSLSMSQYKGPPATRSRLCEAVLSKFALLERFHMIMQIETYQRENKEFVLVQHSKSLLVTVLSHTEQRTSSIHTGSSFPN